MSSTILPGGPFYYHFEGKRDRPIIEFDQYGYFYNTSWSSTERSNRQLVGPKDDVPIVCDFDDTTIAIGQPDRVNEVWICHCNHAINVLFKKRPSNERKITRGATDYRRNTFGPCRSNQNQTTEEKCLIKK